MKAKKSLLKTFVSMLLIFGMVINTVGIQAFATDTPATPSIYYAKSSSYNSALIKWTPLDGVDGYRLYRKLSNTSWKMVAEIKGAEKDSYTDSGLSCGETYYYTLRAYKENKAGAYKDGVAVKIVPAAPKLVSAAAASTTSAKLTWGKVAGANGYLVYCSETSKASDWKKIATITNGSTVTYTHKGLKAGKAYSYTVKAYRIVKGSNIYSGYQSPGILTCTTPDKPKLVSASGSYNSVKITWSKVNYATHYIVYRKTADTKWKVITTVTGNSTVSYTDTDVTLGESYTYTVRAAVRKTEGNWTSSYDGTGITAKVAPSTPVLKGLSAVSCTALKLTWGKVAGATGYRLYRKGPSDKSWQQLTTIKNGATVSFTDTGLTCGKNYTYTVRAYTTQGKKTVWSGYNTKGFSSLAKPAKPTLVNAYALSETSTRLSYSKINDAHGYIIYRKVGSETTWHKIATVTANDVTKYDDKNCKVNTTYTYTVRAYKKVGGTDVLSSYDGNGVSVRVNEKTRVQKNQDLYKINNDFRGWLQIGGTIVDYPVMQDPYDDETYLRKDMYGNPDDDGSLILDSNCNIGTGSKGKYSTDPSSNLIIYGHKRPDSATSGMFRDLSKYDSKSYAEDHKYITLSTTSETRKYQVMSAFYSEVYKKSDTCFKYYEQYNFFTQSEFNYFYNNVKKLSLYNTGVSASFGDEFITLSTCAWYDQDGKWIGTSDDEDHNTGRFVVIAKRIN